MNILLLDVFFGRRSLDGSFHLDAVPPGDYFVVASADASAVVPNDPETLDGLAATAQRVTVGEWDRQTLRVRIARGTAGPACQPRSNCSRAAPMQTHMSAVGIPDVARTIPAASGG